MSQTSALAGKTGVVTGASSGIGRAIAAALARAGAHVFLSGRDQAALDAAVKEIREAGGRADGVAMDVRSPGAIQGLVDRAVADTGRLDVLVNNAGLSHPGKIAEQDPERWREMFDVNVVALLEGCQAGVRAMRQHGEGGTIVNISSVAAHRRDSGVYGATKHAVNCICGTLRTELEDEPINVVNVMPGAIATNFARNLDPEFLSTLGKMVGVEIEPKRGDKLPDDVLDKVQGLMAQQLCTPEDVAEAVLFAVSQPSRVNIEEIVVRPPK
ncbi:MAG: SDR family oxidoreductase, partial [Myxococcota bacterium]|nr:SDR family oxidoreductase [Myxococcota bacterium]